MQPEQTAPAPAIQPAPVAIPAAPLAAIPAADDRTVWISPALVLAALILASLGVMGDAWSVEERSITEESPFLGNTTTTLESDIGLDDYSITSCVDFDDLEICATEMDAFGTSDLGGAYDNCTSQAEAAGANESQIEESCGSLGDMASAGFTGMLFITIGIIALIASLVATFLTTRGTSLPFSQYYPFCGAVTILIGFVAWWLMMPDPPTGSDPSLGSNAWMAIVSIILAAGAGGYSMYTGTLPSSSTGATSTPGSSGRAPGIGARTLAADSEAREFVLRETAMGDRTLSIVEDGHLFRLTRASRGDDGTTAKIGYDATLNPGVDMGPFTSVQ